MTEPTWLPIAEAPRYRVSDSGLVAGVAVPLLRQTPNRQGYLIVSLGGGHHGCRVHKLVLDAFVGPRPPGMQARHLNGRNDDNRLSNLRWGTCDENAQDRLAHGTQVQGMAQGGSILTDRDVLDVVALVSGGTSQGRVAAMFGISQSHVNRITQGHIWRSVTDLPRRPLHPKKQMTPVECAEMTALAEAGISQREIASRFGVRQQSVSRILRRNRRTPLE